MTDDKLEKEVTEYLNTQTLPKIDDFVYLVIKNLIFGFAEPREKRIEELENKIADIKANCDLAIEGKDVKIMELEQQISKTKDLQEELEKQNKELKEQIEKMKRCANCKKGNCSYSSFSIDKNGKKTFHNWNEEKGDFCNTGYKSDYKYWELAE